MRRSTVLLRSGPAGSTSGRPAPSPGPSWPTLRETSSASCARSKRSPGNREAIRSRPAGPGAVHPARGLHRHRGPVLPRPPARRHPAPIPRHERRPRRAGRPVTPGTQGRDGTRIPARRGRSARPRSCRWARMWLREGACMGGPQSAHPAASNRPAGSEALLVLLPGSASEAERTLVTRWLRDGDLQPAAVLPLDGPGLARSLDRAAPETVVTAVRVAWLPRERGGERKVRWSDVLSQVNPRRPPVFWQSRILRREPDRARMVVAEPATVAALRGRWGGTGSFAQFVSRQARLALDRSERALLGHRYKVPKEVTEAIVDSPDFRAEVARLADRMGLTEQEVLGRAEADLDSLVASMSPIAVDLLSSTLRPLHARAWDVQVDTAGLDRLRARSREHALVFLPSHRSYADPLLLADVLAEHDFPPNHVLGGDNLRFWPIAPLARRAGVVFIRRSFSDDEIYKLALREYLGFLLAKRFNLEWYMEGGRSRTGKLRPPRYGLLAYVAEAVARGRAEDAWLVPVAITYDQLREVSAMAAEQAGAAKKAEGLGWLAAYARGQLARVGTVYVRFAEPMSLRVALPPGGPDGDPVGPDPAAPPAVPPGPAAPAHVRLDPAAPPKVSLDPAAPPRARLVPPAPPSAGLDPAAPPSAGLDPAAPPSAGLDP